MKDVYGLFGRSMAADQMGEVSDAIMKEKTLAEMEEERMIAKAKLNGVEVASSAHTSRRRTSTRKNLERATLITKDKNTTGAAGDDGRKNTNPRASFGRRMSVSTG